MALCLAVWILPAAMQAQFTFATNNGSLTLTGYSGSDHSVTIPGTMNGLPVGSVGGHAFYANLNVFSISIPASVTNYATGAFVNCSNLTAVYFQGNAPKDFFPAAAPVFSGNNKATLYYVPGTAGWGTTFDLLPTVQWNPQVLNQLAFTTNGGVITITGYTGPGGAVVIPGTINGFLVGSVGNGAFLNSSVLAGLTLPVTVTNVESLAFAGCTALTNVNIQPGVFGSGLFSNCTALVNVVILTNVANIAASEFSGCSALKTITIPGSVTNLGPWAFQNCYSLNAIYFEGNAPAADPTVFAGASNATNYYLPKTAGWGATLAGRPVIPILFTFTTNSGAISVNKYIGIWGSVVVPDTINGLPVTTIGNGAFNGCASLTNINVGPNITGIAGQAFVVCPDLLTINVDALNSVYSSLDGVLFNKSRTAILYYPGGRAGSYTIPDGVTSIPSYAFQACSGLTTLQVPSSVVTIGSLAFNVDPSLTAIYFRGNAPTVASFGFEIQNTVIIYYLPGATGWSADLGALATALWKPKVLTDDGSFGVGTNSFGFHINWASGMNVVVDACTNLVNPIWLPLQTNTLANDSSYFNDPLWTNYSSRYYRLRSP